MADHSFEIYLAWSDRHLTVEPNTSALNVLLAAGMAIKPGCQAGGCAMCAIPYVEGDLLHKDT